MDIFLNQAVFFWLVALVIFIGVELFTLGLATIWFAGGAIIAMVMAFLGFSWWVQGIVFCVVSLILLFTVRPIALKHFNHDRELTNVESLINKKAIVVSEINNIEGTGIVKVGGQNWTARSYYEEDVIPVGSVVIVKAIEGVKLLVRVKEA